MELVEIVDAALAVRQGEKKLADIPEEDRPRVRAMMTREMLLAERAASKEKKTTKPHLSFSQPL
jgi:hypothetical protein